MPRPIRSSERNRSSACCLVRDMLALFYSIQRSAVSIQLSAVSTQQSALSGQHSAVSYTCLVFNVRFLESSSRTPSTSARSHQRASRGEGPCACSLDYFLKWHKPVYRNGRKGRK